MSRILITGSADGLGQLAAELLIEQGHQVVLHARNKQRAEQAMEKTPGAENILIADLSIMEETKNLAENANKTGAFDAVIHNAGVFHVSGTEMSADGIPLLFAVNSLAPFILTALMPKPGRLIYMSSGMHLQGNADLEGLIPDRLRNPGAVTYSDTKLHDLILSKAVAGKWPAVFANAVNPGWVPTRMGGTGAPDDLVKGFQTQAWLAVSQDKEAKVSGRYFFHKKENRYAPIADEVKVQEKFMAVCEQMSGVRFPS
jgi:NAD(P)-dependent dehydrogenase (short-subunit alcohol dehydrogenase family)